jgi:hypothetical protein
MSYDNSLSELSQLNSAIANEDGEKEANSEVSFLEKKKAAAKKSAKGKGKGKGKKKKAPKPEKVCRDKYGRIKACPKKKKVVKKAGKGMTPPPSGTQVHMIPNKLLFQKTKGIENYTKCTKKTGILNMIRGQSKLPFVLNLLPTYIYLGLSTFNIYRTRSSKTMMTTLKLVDIVRINQRKLLTKFNCFDLILSDWVQLRLKGDNLITLCAKNQSEMTKWIKAFLEFKECQVDVKKLNNSDQVMLDYKKVSDLLRKAAVAAPVAKKAINVMYYDSTDNAYRKPAKAIYRNVKVKKIVGKIMEAMKKGNMRNDQVKRQLKDKLKKARKFTQDVGKKQGAIEGLVARRVNLERKKQIVKVGKKQRKKEVALLNAVKQRMTQLKKKEIKDLSKRVKKEIKSEKKKASGEAKTMMRTLINAKKLSPYDDCIDNRLFNFSDKNYVSTTCKRYYGEFVSFFFIFFLIYLFFREKKNALLRKITVINVALIM